MFEGIVSFFKKFAKSEEESTKSKDTAKERLHLVLMQDRANVSADFLEMMKQEIIDVIKKYIDVEEKEIDVKLTNKTNEDGSVGAPALYANIPIGKIKNESKINYEKKEATDKSKISNNKQTENENSYDEIKDEKKPKEDINKKCEIEEEKEEKENKEAAILENSKQSSNTQSSEKSKKNVAKVDKSKSTKTSKKKRK